MDKIKILDNLTINNIAAGEVVERPVSVIKELVENSIDAKSTSILVEIKNGGISYIRVRDNGIGIPKDDIQLAFTKHATSKISNIQDLESILTMGFRGEALASIASVSQLEVITRTRQDSLGTHLRIIAGNIESEKSVGTAEGTTLILQNLFYNVPARKKFLKKVSKESLYIKDMIIRFAFSHTNIEFTYINNDEIVFKTKGKNDLASTIFKLYGKDVYKNLIEINYSENGIVVTGFIGKPFISRGNRSYQHFFLNKRYVKNEIIQKAVEDAFKGKIMIGKFPFYILNMTIEPTLVDVNVHPSKLEVRFYDDSIIYQIAYNSVFKSFKSEILIPRVEIKDNPISNKFNKDKWKQSEILPNVRLKDKNFNNDNRGLKIQENATVELDKSSMSFIKPISIDDNKIMKFDENKKVENLSEKLPFFNNYTIKGQIFNTYWILEQDKSIYLIDQHAAHEKAMYEKIIQQVDNNTVSSQGLIEPIILNLTEKETGIILENKNLLEEFGFQIEEFGNNCFALKGVPFIIKGNILPLFFMDIIDILGKDYAGIKNIYHAKRDLIASMSCKAAVKANDNLTFVEARALIESMLQLEDPFTCPHGRPTIIEISKQELDKKFKRIQ